MKKTGEANKDGADWATNNPTATKSATEECAKAYGARHTVLCGDHFHLGAINALRKMRNIMAGKRLWYPT